MSFFALSPSSSWQAFWVQSAGNRHLYQESFSLFNKKPVAAQQTPDSNSAHAHQAKWAPQTVALPSWAQLH
jgi:hypothetical protein